MNTIKVLNINKEIKKNIILSDINLELKQNTIYGFVGPNGSGKSSLFKIISSLWKPTSGNVLINDSISLNEKNYFSKNISSFIEFPNTYENLTVKQNLNIVIKLYDIKDLSYYNYLVNKFKINDFLNKKIKKLSLGMKQKVGLVMTLIKKSDILILDEPTNSLDLESVQILHYIIKERKQKSIILISSHILEETKSLCDEIICLELGTIKKIIKNDGKLKNSDLFCL